jgi:hypothetical protein
MMTPAAAWSSVKTQLKADLSASFYQRYIENTDSRYADHTLTLICEDEEVCQGLQSPQISRKIGRLFSACVGKEVVFEYEIAPCEDAQDPELSAPTNLSEISIESTTLSEYESRVKSHQVIVVPGYFRKFIPLMDPEIAWLYIAFRQMAYLSGFKNKGQAVFSVTGKRIASFAGMSYSAFKRRFADPKTWEKLQWLVTPQEGMGQTPWKIDQEGRPHRTAHTYHVRMDLPLTPGDQKCLQDWLARNYGRSENYLETLQQAISTPVQQILSDYRQEEISFEGVGMSVADVAMKVCPADLQGSEAVQALVKQLVHHFMPPNDLIVITHYFIKNWAPKLSAAQAWMVILMRDLSFYDPQTGYQRNEVFIQGGYRELADALGLNRIRTIRNWLKTDKLGQFVEELDQEYGIGTWETCPRRFRVRLEEPDPEAIVANETNRDANSTAEIVASEQSYSTGTNVDNWPQPEDVIVASETNRQSQVSHSVVATEPNRLSQVTPLVVASEPFSGRNWDCINLLNPVSPHAINTDQPPASALPEEWQRATLFKNCVVENAVRKKLVDRQVTGQLIVSWLLYAASPRGTNITDPVGFTISRLTQNPKKGAGGGFDRLSQRSPQELVSLIRETLLLHYPRDHDWSICMDGARKTKLLELIEYLDPQTANSLKETISTHFGGIS